MKGYQMKLDLYRQATIEELQKRNPNSTITVGAFKSLNLNGEEETETKIIIKNNISGASYERSYPLDPHAGDWRFQTKVGELYWNYETITIRMHPDEKPPKINISELV